MAKPCLTNEDALNILNGIYRINPSSIEPLPSYDDQNMMVKIEDRPQWVLKATVVSEDDWTRYILNRQGSVNRDKCFSFSLSTPFCFHITHRDSSSCGSYPEEVISHLELEHQAMRRVDYWSSCPTPMYKSVLPISNIEIDSPSSRGISYDRSIEQLSQHIHLKIKKVKNGQTVYHFVRLISFLKGEILAKISPQIPSSHNCFFKLGIMVANVGQALYHDVSKQWNPTASHRYLSWDLLNACKVEEFIDEVKSHEDKLLVKKWLQRFKFILDQSISNNSAVDHSISNNSAVVETEVGENHINKKIKQNKNENEINEIVCDLNSDMKGILSNLPEQVIHGDLNDYNVLINMTNNLNKMNMENHQRLNDEMIELEDDAISVIDFGDMVWSKRIFDIAIALAYFCQQRQNAQEVVEIACQVLKGYHDTTSSNMRSTDSSSSSSSSSSTVSSRNQAEEAGVRQHYPSLNELEAKVLPICIGARLCQSLIMSAHSIKLDPENIEYLSVSAAPGWKLLRQWDELDQNGLLDAIVKAASPGL